MQTQEKPIDSAEHVDHADEMGLGPKDIAIDAAAKGQATSGYENLTPWETVKKFKICTLVCFLAAFSAATDGYQIGSDTTPFPVRRLSVGSSSSGGRD